MPSRAGGRTVGSMDWFSVVLWSLIAFVALPLGLGAIAHPLLGVQALAVLGGLTVAVLWLFDIGSEDTAWIGSRARCAALAASVAGAWLVDGDRDVSSVRQSREETRRPCGGGAATRRPRGPADARARLRPSHVQLGQPAGCCRRRRRGRTIEIDARPESATRAAASLDWSTCHTCADGRRRLGGLRVVHFSPTARQRAGEGACHREPHRAPACTALAR